MLINIVALAYVSIMNISIGIAHINARVITRCTQFGLINPLGFAFINMFFTSQHQCRIQHPCDGYEIRALVHRQFRQRQSLCSNRWGDRYEAQRLDHRDWW